jgi:hypothetical protein
MCIALVCCRELPTAGLTFYCFLRRHIRSLCQHGRKVEATWNGTLILFLWLLPVVPVAGIHGLEGRDAGTHDLSPFPRHSLDISYDL